MTFNKLIFKDYPEFKPNLTPKDIFSLGSFGGTYWRPINSKVNKKKYKNIHKKYKEKWWKHLPESWLSNSWENYDVNINKYKVKVGTTLEFWEEKGWISETHPYGWVHWYCDFYSGKRCKDDRRQIDRWLALAGEKGRFRRRLINLILDSDTHINNYEISPKIRQTLQHWGYMLTKEDLV